MPADIDPIVGNWYQRLDQEQKFEVVAIDEDEGVVEIQYFDGELEGIDLDTWHDLELEPMEPPEDWTGPLDNVNDEEEAEVPADWSAGEWHDEEEGREYDDEAWDKDGLDEEEAD